MRCSSPSSARGARGPRARAWSVGGPLPRRLPVVLDEAHTVQEVAEENFGLALSSLGIERTLKHLFNPRTRRGIMKKRGDADFRQGVADAPRRDRPVFRRLSPPRSSRSARSPACARRTRSSRSLAPRLPPSSEASPRPPTASRTGATGTNCSSSGRACAPIRGGLDEWLTLSNERPRVLGGKGRPAPDDRDAQERAGGRCPRA